MGGLAQGQEVVAMFRNRGTGDLANLASWILNRQVISFDWQSKIWLPLFQFNRADMAPLPGLREVLAELTPAYQAWELAHWFIQPHPWLDQQTPAQALATDQGAVLNAACFDRLIATNKR
jgi:hypothetical protein